jgi:hypothetical protein
VSIGIALELALCQFVVLIEQEDLTLGYNRSALHADAIYLKVGSRITSIRTCKSQTVHGSPASRYLTAVKYSVHGREKAYAASFLGMVYQNDAHCSLGALSVHRNTTWVEYRAIADFARSPNNGVLSLYDMSAV